MNIISGILNSQRLLTISDIYKLVSQITSQVANFLIHEVRCNVFLILYELFI